MHADLGAAKRSGLGARQTSGAGISGSIPLTGVGVAWSPGPFSSRRYVYEASLFVSVSPHPPEPPHHAPQDNDVMVWPGPLESCKPAFPSRQLEKRDKTIFMSGIRT